MTQNDLNDLQWPWVISKMTLDNLVWPYGMWTMQCRQNLDRTGRSRSDCSFRFADFTWFSIWFSVFVKNWNGFFQKFSAFFRSEPPLISDSRETQMLLTEMRDKPNVAKITSRWLNIVGIRRRSCVSNNIRDSDLAMLSTKVDHFANYCFQRALNTSNGRSSRTLIKKQQWIVSRFS